MPGWPPRAACQPYQLHQPYRDQSTCVGDSGQSAVEPASDVPPLPLVVLHWPLVHSVWVNHDQVSRVQPARIDKGSGGSAVPSCRKSPS
jgi:hypothetical protein